MLKYIRIISWNFSNIYKNKNELFKRGLIERAFDGGFRSREEYRLSDKARTLLLKEYNIKIR